jgi:hypothetical protein
LTLGQDDAIEKGGPSYWILISASLVPIVLSIRHWFRGLFAEFLWVPIFFLVSAGWGAIRGDGGIVLTLLMVSLSWVYSQCSAARIEATSFARLFVVIVLLGIVFRATSDSNYYEIIPWSISDPRADGRVSFAGNIGFSGMFSLLAFIVLAGQRKRAPIVWVALSLSAYFIVFSRVRTALIGLMIFAVMFWFTSRKTNASPRFFFFLATFVLVLTITAISVAPLVLVNVQSTGLVSDLFLQGKQSLDADEISEQLYRPLLWAAHLQLFFSSPYLMGWGEAAPSMVESAGAGFLSGGDTVSLPTRLLAHYGIPGILFIWAAISALRRHSRAHDLASVCAWPVCVLVMLSWGSAFHPTDAVGVIYLIVLFRGISAFR